MEINYTFYFFAFLRKMIKKLLTFCYWKSNKKLFAKLFYACNCEFSIFFGYMRNVPFGY